MKEYKFWAIVFSIKKLRLYAFSVIIIFTMGFINITDYQYFFYLLAPFILIQIIVILLVVKRVQLKIEKDRLHIKFSGKTALAFRIEDLQYVRGPNVDLPYAQGEINLVFRDKIITLNVIEWRGLVEHTANEQVLIIRTLFETYNLEFEGQDTKHQSKLYIYKNPQYRI